MYRVKDLVMNSALRIVNYPTTQEFHMDEERTREAFDLFYDPVRNFVLVKEKRLLKAFFIVPMSSVKYLQMQDGEIEAMLLPPDRGSAPPDIEVGEDGRPKTPLGISLKGNRVTQALR